MEAAWDAGFRKFLGATEYSDTGYAVLPFCENRGLPAPGKGFENRKLFKYASFAASRLPQ
jgi:hypothetical protein